MIDDKQIELFNRRLFLSFFVLVIAVVVPIGGIAYYLDTRLKSLEVDLDYKAPGSAGSSIERLDELPWVPHQGQVVYVPVYSHVYRERIRPELLTIVLSVRNTAIDQEIVLTSVRYFDTDGKLVRAYIDQPLLVGPLATSEFVVERDDREGGSGANFIVEWASGQPVTEPVIEALMIGTSENLGISFVRQGKVIREIRPEKE